MSELTDALDTINNLNTTQNPTEKSLSTAEGNAKAWLSRITDCSVNFERSKSDRIIADLLLELQTIQREPNTAIPDIVESLRTSLHALTKFFVSGNNIPVERATIQAKDFWMIVGGSSRTLTDDDLNWCDNIYSTGMVAPCPYCRSKTPELYRPTLMHAQIVCSRCGADGPVGNTPDEALELWNRRPVITLKMPISNKKVINWPLQIANVPHEIVYFWIKELHPEMSAHHFVEGDGLGHHVWLDGDHHCSLDLNDPPAWLVLKTWGHMQGAVACDGCEAGDLLFGLEATKRQAEQSGLNTRWLIGQVDKAHSDLCPREIGTWQQRADQLVRKAAELSAQAKELNERPTESPSH